MKKKFAPKRKMIKRKSYARRRPTSLVNRALHPIPQRFVTKMKYSEVISGGATFGDVSINLNSVYDPNRSGIGHQPYAFDTLAALYNRYRVISCGYRIQCATPASGNTVLTAMPANTVVVTGTASELRENPRCKYITQTGGGNSIVLSGKSYIPSLVGRSKAQYMADDRYQSEVTGSPNELAILNIQLFGISTDAPITSTPVQVVLEYTVEFFDIKSLGQS